MTKDLESLERAIGVAGSIIASEHFFSTLLSSPWTTQKFCDTLEEQELVRKMLFLASGISLVFAGGVSYLIKDKYPIIFTFILCLFYIVVYEKSLKKEL
jgi:hypothetical protein